MEEIKAEGANSSGRLTAENLANLGGGDRNEIEEMKRKYAIHTFADA